VCVRERDLVGALFCCLPQLAQVCVCAGESVIVRVRVCVRVRVRGSV